MTEGTGGPALSLRVCIRIPEAVGSVFKVAVVAALCVLDRS